MGRLRRRSRRALRRGARARRRADPHRRGRPGLRRRGLGLLLPARGDHARRRADDARDAQRAGRGIRSRGDLPHLERRRRRGRRHAHQPGVVRGRARRHRLARAHRLDEVHARRLLQLAAAERHARAGRAAADRGVPVPARVRELRRVPQRPRPRVPVRAAAAARREREHRGHLDLDAGRRAVARRPDDAVPQGRVLAAVRARHASSPRRSPATPRPTSPRSPRAGRGSGSRTTRRPSTRSSRR